MLVILSGQYLESELAAEFGEIPPAFLPVGNKRLYTYQMKRFGPAYSRVVLTVPSDFKVEEADQAELDDCGIQLLKVPQGLRLGDSVSFVLDSLSGTGRIDFLYGDTLIDDMRLEGSDWIAVGESDEFYKWHYEKGSDAEGGLAWCGMFSFSDRVRLRGYLGHGKDFLRAVERYAEGSGLERRRVEKWLDFGHVHTYFTSKLSATTQRHFNQLAISRGVLTKTSDDARKMEAEASWFEQAPAQVRHYLPNYLGRRPDGGAGYVLEYLPLAALNELFVFGRLPAMVWNKILAACSQFLEASSKIAVPDGVKACDPEAVYIHKTRQRLESFSSQTSISLDEPWTLDGVSVPSLAQVAKEMGERVTGHPSVPAFIHGDLCFSNILFDFRSGRIKVIDPRGLDSSGGLTSFGDLRYDIGKLSHSVLGLYDFIIAGHFRLQREGQHLEFAVLDGHSSMVREVFLSKPILGKLPADWDCYPVMVLLFLSMLPLHVDNPPRQMALMANALRLYQEAVQ